MSIEDFPMDTLLSAEVLVRFKVEDVCTRNDLVAGGISFEELVRGLIESDGLWGIVGEYPAILEVKVWQS